MDWYNYCISWIFVGIINNFKCADRDNNPIHSNYINSSTIKLCVQNSSLALAYIGASTHVQPKNSKHATSLSSAQIPRLRFKGDIKICGKQANGGGRNEHGQGGRGGCSEHRCGRQEISA